MGAVRELEIRWGPIPGTGQEAFFDDDTPDAALLLCAGWGAGKTMTLWGKMLKLSTLNAPLPGIWVVPQYDHILHTLIPKLEEVDPQTGEHWFLSSNDYEFREYKHEFYWAGGGPIWFKSADHAEAIAGPNVAFAGIDEPINVSQKAWRNTAARVRHIGAKLRQTIAAGTADEMSWMDDYFFDPERPDRYKRYMMATSDNSELLKYDPTYIQRIQENATEAEIAAFVHGKGMVLDGQAAYPQFDADIHWRGDVDAFDRNQPLVLSCDFNVAPMCWVIGQKRVGPNGPEAHVLDGVNLEVATTDMACDELIRKFPYVPQGWDVYGDSNGRNRTPQSHKSNYQIIAERLSVTGPVRLKVPNFDPPIHDRLQAVNRALKTASGKTTLWIRKWEPYRECPTRGLVRSLQRSKIAAGTQKIEKKSGDVVTHAADALGYWLVAEWPVRKPEIKAGAMRVDWLL